MEKSGRIILTEREFDTFKRSGVVPKSVEAIWEVTSQELSDMIAQGNFSIINEEREQ